MSQPRNTNSDIPAGLRPIDDAVPPSLTPITDDTPAGLTEIDDGEPTPPESRKLRPSIADITQPISATQVDAEAFRDNLREKEAEAQRQRDYEQAVRQAHTALGTYASRLGDHRAEAQQEQIAAMSEQLGIPTPQQVDLKQVAQATAEELSTAESIVTSFERTASATMVGGVRRAGGVLGFEQHPESYYSVLTALDDANKKENGAALAGSFGGLVADPVWLGIFGLVGKGLRAAGVAGRAGREAAIAGDFALAGGGADLVRGVAQGHSSGKIKQDMALGAALGGVMDAALVGARAARGTVSDAPEHVRHLLSPRQEQLAEDTLIGRLRQSLRRNLTSAGGLPPEMFASKTAATGRIEASLTESAFAIRELERAARDVYGGWARMTDAQRTAIDDALKGTLPVSALPGRIAPLVTRMRSHLDSMSRELIDSGAVEGRLVATVQGNLGQYVNRSYRVFDDPNWARRVPEDVRNRAKSWLRSEYPGRSEAEIHGLIDRLLMPQANSPLAFIDSGRLGAKDLGILTRRREIPAELRSLWGEYEGEAIVNYARSAEKMAHLIGNHRFLTEAREAGTGRFFFEQPIRQDGVSYSVRIADDNSRTFAPLAGLNTSKEISQALADALEPNRLPTWMRGYMRVNGAVKYSKTVLSLTTHIRNLLGNTGFAVANGHWRATHMNKAFRATWTNLRKIDDAGWRDFYLDLQRLGVVGDSANAGELRAVLRDVAGRDANAITGNFAQRAARRAGRFVQSAYQAEDDIWKIFAFEHELARYRNALPDLSEDALRRRVADIVRRTYPTYSRVPRGVRGIRRSPLVGAFTSFPQQVVQTAYHTIKLTADELADPALRGIGAQRLAGLLVAAGGTTGMAIGSRFLTGTDRDQEDDLRRFVAPWSRNSQYLHLGEDEDGNRRFVDVGFVDPHSYIRKPLMALLRGEDWEKAVIDAGLEAASPFFSEEILLGRLLDVNRNKKPSGSRVFNPEDNTLDRWASITDHLWGALEPGTITSMERIAAGLTGEVNQYGRDYDAGTEALATFTGQRITTIDLRQGLSFKARATARRINDVSRAFNAVLTDRGEVDEAELREAATEAERDRRRIFTELHKDVTAAIRLGVSDNEVRDILANAGLSQRNIYAVMSNDLPAFDPSPRALESAIDRDRLMQEDDPQIRRLEERLEWMRALEEDRDE